MIIAVEYKNGRIKEFDTSAFTSGDALSSIERGSRNMMTEFDLRLDRLDEDGLVLDVFWYDPTRAATERVLDDARDENGHAAVIKCAQRRIGYSVVIVNQRVLELVSRITVYRANGAVQAAWRQGSGNWLIKGSLFEAQRVLTYTDATTTSLNSQACTMFSYLRRAHPASSDAEIAAMMSYPIDALEEIMGELGMQDIGDGDPEAEGGSPELLRRYGRHFAPGGEGDSEAGESIGLEAGDLDGDIEGVSGYELLLAGGGDSPNPMLADFGDEEEDEEEVE